MSSSSSSYVRCNKKNYFVLHQKKINKTLSNHCSLHSTCDVATSTSVTSGTPPLYCHPNAAPDASEVRVFWRLVQAASLVRRPRPTSCTKGALFKPESAALRVAASEEAVTQRAHPLHKSSSDQERL